MAAMEDHGGACCGVRHIYGMDGSTYAEVDELIAQVDNEEGQGNRLIEIILSARQVGAPGQVMQNRNPEGGWPAFMQSRGFRLVSRFNNSNSRNDCYIFHRVPHFLSLAVADLPFTWRHERNPQRNINGAGGPGVMPAPAPRVEVREVVREATVRVVDTYWCNVYRNRSHFRHGTLARAREVGAQAPRCRRTDRCDIYSNGDQIWTEGV